MGLRRRHDRAPKWKHSRRLTVCKVSVFPGASFLCMRSSPIKSRRSLLRSSRATHNADLAPENSVGPTLARDREAGNARKEVGLMEFRFQPDLIERSR